jgi:hypothetical protein
MKYTWIFFEVLEVQEPKENHLFTTIYVDTCFFVFGHNATADITKFEACNCSSRKRVEGIYQNEDCIEEDFVSDALLFAIFLPFSSRVHVCFDKSW